MTIYSRRWALLSAGGLLIIGLSAACGPVSLPFVQSGPDSGKVAVPQASQPVQSAPVVVRPAATPTVARTGAAAARRVPVTRASLTETLALDGLVAAQDQVPLTYPQRALVDEVLVKEGQAVKQGDVLIKLDGSEITQRLDAARARLQSSKQSLVQAQALIQAAAQRAVSSKQQQQLAVLDAQVGLQHAVENLKTVQAGRSASDRQAQQTAVSYGLAQLQQTQDALDKLLAGPDEATVRATQREVATNQVALAKAQADLDVLIKGPDANAVRAADSALQRAQTQLKVAQASKSDPKVDPALANLQHEAAVQEAQMAVDTSQAALAKLKQPPSTTDLQAAKQHVQDAQDNVTVAQNKVVSLQAGPDQAKLNDAQAHLEYVRHYLGETQANLDEVLSHPTPLELASAQDQVRKAQTTLDAAQRGPDATEAAPDLGALQAAIDQDQSEVTRLERLLQENRVTAPFDGVVLAVRAKTGDVITSAKPVLTLAKSGPPIVRVDLAESEVGRLAVDQEATVRLGFSASTTAPLQAVVDRLPPAPNDGSAGPSAILRVTWANGQTPRFGTPVQVIVNVQQKQGVLVVPRSAIRQSGGKAKVEVQDGSLRRLVSVQVGITTTDSAEIVSGLSEGQIVLAGPA
jgi:multidrug efflux pump subunit AcrA (membrane-fusion protein)